MAGYPMPEFRGILRRSHRARNRHFSHVLAPSAVSAPHAHCRPLRHPFNLCPMLTSCQRSLAFGKVRSAKNAASPGTIGSGKRRVSFRAPPLIPVRCGAARLYSVILAVFPGLARAVSSPARGRGLIKFPDPGPPEMGGDFLRAGESVIVLGRPAPPRSLLGTRAGVMLPLRRRPPASVSHRSGRRY
jgi:hypothetical protein